MFLEHLNEPQKRAFLILAHRVTQADGEDSAEEHEALETLCREMAITFEVDMRDVLADIDVTHFDSHGTRVIAGLELMRMVYADDYVHEGEVAEVMAICQAMAFNDPWITTMREWAKRLSWAEEDPLDSQRAEYHQKLVLYARHIISGGT